jgi:hypothetical protein
MKTAISVPDNVFAAAERAARRMGISRSEFFTRAAQRMTRREEARNLTARIDAALAKAGGAAVLDPALLQMQAAALGEESW